MDSVYFKIIKKKKIFCILSEPKLIKKKIVIMSHGFRGSSIGPARTFVDFTHLLIKENFSVLRFDQPNSGNSVGNYLNSSFNEWVNTTTYFAKEFLDKGYKVALLGQSMGATTTMIATARPDIKGKIPCILLWVPDPKSTYNRPKDKVYEEGGQKYKGTFWQEAKDSDFFGCLENYKGKIHLVYGDKDRYVSKEMRKQVIKKVREKGQYIIILPNQDHSPWEFDIVQKVYKEEVKILKQYLD